MKYYAVKKGRTPGLYTSWDECKKSVFKFPGAIYKSFETEKEAVEYLENDEPKEEKELKITANNYAFVDGSYNAKTKKYGYGAVVVLNDVKDEDDVAFCKYLNGSGNRKDMLSMRNVAGEILGCQVAVTTAIGQGVKDITIIYDYYGIEKWATGEWKANKKSTKEYRKFIKKSKESININFIKVKGHTGVQGNELADKLAKTAVGLYEGKEFIVNKEK